MIGGTGLSASVYAATHAASLRAAEQTHQPQTNNQTSDKDGAKPGASAASDPQSQSGKPRDPSKGTKANGEPLSEAEERQVRTLKETDAKVRAHEQAHAIAGGPYASAPKYEYTTGPDGKRYAVAGEVQIDTAPEEGDPEATIRKMEVVIRAALAPADPSPQDLQVARQAQLQRAKAQAELTKQRTEEGSDGPAESRETGPASGDNRGENGFAQRAVSAYREAAEAGVSALLQELVAQT